MRTKPFIHFEPAIEDGSNDPLNRGDEDGEERKEDDQVATDHGHEPTTWTQAWLRG